MSRLAEAISEFKMNVIGLAYLSLISEPSCQYVRDRLTAELVPFDLDMRASIVLALLNYSYPHKSVYEDQ